MATGTYAPDPDLRIVDANGNPISGGLIWTYLAGTTTPTPTWTDVGLSVPNSNPIIAGSDGRFVAFLSATVSYKFVYETPAIPPAHGAVVITRDNVLPFPGPSNPASDPGLCEVRMTLTQGQPVSPDVASSPTIFLEPYKGNRIALYDGAVWNLRFTAPNSFPVPAVAGAVFDAFLWDQGSIPSIETVQWTNDTTRGTALTTQDGVLVKSGNPTRRYIGTFRTTGSGFTRDDSTLRYVWNFYNRVQRRLRVVEGSTTWPYTLATMRQANGSVNNAVEVVVGLAEARLSLRLTVMVSNTTGGVNVAAVIGEDSTTTFDAVNSVGGAIQASSAVVQQVHHALDKYPPIGRHVYSWNEWSTAVGTTNWFSLSLGLTNVTSGIIGWIEG